MSPMCCITLILKDAILFCLRIILLLSWRVGYLSNKTKSTAATVMKHRGTVLMCKCITRKGKGQMVFIDITIKWNLVNSQSHSLPFQWKVDLQCRMVTGWKRNIFSVSPPVVSSRDFWGEFFFIQFKSLKTVNAICCTDCKAPWRKCMMWHWAYI